MNVIPTELPGVLVLEPRVFGDPRGWFMELFHASRYAQHGIRGPFLQDNVSFSQRGVLRGLHFQNPRAQGKLVFPVQGEIWDVAVDIRRGSPTFGKWIGVSLSSTNRRQIWVPAGFAHGFYVVSETATVVYKCTDEYSPATEHGIAWDDPNLAIPWPDGPRSLSEKDKKYPTLAAIEPEKLFVHAPG